jgi:D-alanyl-D-alanine carboxypeptidase (penicillin-binding protein 5/6)
MSETGMTMYNSMFERLDSPVFGNGNGEIIGGKTGFTDEAGLCLASLATTESGKEYIVVTTNAPGNSKTKPFHILDALKLYDKYAK